MMRALAKDASASARKELIAHAQVSPAARRAAARAHGRFDATPQEIAHYIGQISAELSTMARKSDLGLLAYFLQMAHAEARALSRKFEHGHGHHS
ncbi:MAG TPA: hypothetical protein VG124_10105 [Beijerinckiaceae bacterium]|jgi:hypothetical protein|nr:hypothetical protein [Beijerinckiaceae bacterium]